MGNSDFLLDVILSQMGGLSFSKLTLLQIGEINDKLVLIGGDK